MAFEKNFFLNVRNFILNFKNKKEKKKMKKILIINKFKISQNLIFFFYFFSYSFWMIFMYTLDVYAIEK